MKTNLALVACIALAHCAPTVESTEQYPNVSRSMALEATCSTTLASSETATTIVLSLDGLRSTALSATTRTALTAAGVPESVPSLASMTGKARARLLQQTMRAANALASGIVHVTVNVPAACDFDYSTYGSGGPDEIQGGVDPVAYPYDVPFLPKLHIGSVGNITLQGDPSTEPGIPAPRARPRLWYAGAGKDGTNHGRVLLLVTSGPAKPVTVDRLNFEGDHTTSGSDPITNYLHENDAGLVTDLNRRSWHGLVVVGVRGGSNDVTISRSLFSKMNLHAVAVVGNATIDDIDVTGVLPAMNSLNRSMFDANIEQMSTTTNPAGSTPTNIGFATNNGVYQQGQADATMVVTNSKFRNVVEGIVGGGLGIIKKWTIYHNEFDRIGDHGVYLLGPVNDSIVTNNTFSRSRHYGIKIHDHCDAEPWSGAKCGAYRVQVSNNQFSLMHQGSISMSGTRNTIQSNTVTPYAAPPPGSTDDETPGYDPRVVLPSGKLDEFPDLFLGTNGGQSVSANHVAYNTFIGNSKGSADLVILISQQPREDANDVQAERSVAFNKVSGAGQKVYFNTRVGSLYPPIIFVGDGALLEAGAPPNCASCQPENPAYRHDLVNFNPSGALFDPVPATGATPAGLLMRFGTESVTYFVREDGVHAKLGGAGDDIRVHAVAHLKGSGGQEIYWSYGAYPELGLMGLQPPAGVSAWALAARAGSWQYAPVAPVRAARATLRAGGVAEHLVAAFPGDAGLYGTKLVGDTPLRADASLYTPGSGPLGSSAVAIQAADLSAEGESGTSADEVDVGFANGKIVGVRWSGTAFVQQTVYELSGWMPQIAQMEPGRVRRSAASCGSPEAKQRLYHRFVGSPIIYETVPTASGLPGLGTGNYFYAGSLVSDLLVAADLDGDGRQEMNTHFTAGTSIYYGQHETCGAPTVNWASGSSYAGWGTALAMRRLTIDGQERLLTIFGSSRTVYASTGMANNGFDYLQRIRDLELMK